MKRIVIFVVPNETGHEDATPSPQHAGPRQILNEPPAGTITIDVVVDDTEATRICEAIMSIKPRRNGHELSSDENEPGDNRTIRVQVDSIIRDRVPSSSKTNVLEQMVAEVERQLIALVYTECHFVKSRAARRLGINRNTLLKKLRRYGVGPV